MSVPPASCEARSGKPICRLTLLMIINQPGGADYLCLKRWLETEDIIGQCLVDFLLNQQSAPSETGSGGSSGAGGPNEAHNGFEWSK